MGSQGGVDKARFAMALTAGVSAAAALVLSSKSMRGAIANMLKVRATTVPTAYHLP